jgi:thiol-disulfide isomerase/thioredoxin
MRVRTSAVRFRFATAAVCAAAALAAPPAFAGDELPLGAPGPAFELKGTDGAMHSLQSLMGPKGTAVIFTCNTCPFAKGYEDRLIALAHDYKTKGIGFVAINPNDPEVQPGEDFDAMVARAKEKNLPYPYLVDTTQVTAIAYGAHVTPHVFLLDAQGRLVYRGRVDDALDQGKVKERDFQSALAALIAGRPISVAETKAFGCGVKWAKKPGA